MKRRQIPMKNSYCNAKRLKLEIGRIRELAKPTIEPSDSTNAVKKGAGKRQRSLAKSVKTINSMKPAKSIDSTVLNNIEKPVKSSKPFDEPLQRLLHVCQQRNPTTWSAEYKKCLKTAKKLGEGLYGEVFKITRNRKQIVAVKIMPIGGDFPVNDEPQKSCAEVLPEVVIARHMSEMADKGLHMTPNFVKLHNVRVVKGKYPVDLLRAWDTYFNSGRQCDNERPDIFGNNQLFVVMEFVDAGLDLDNYKFRSSNEAYSIFGQVLFSLAIAERKLEFEHRDLHVGNIMVKPTNQKQIVYHLNGGVIRLQSHGVHVSIIDFTNSRLKKHGCTLYTDLSKDEGLFEGPNTDYQFQVYRMMRLANNNNWQSFNGRSNLYWLHYLIDKLRQPKRYLRPKTGLTLESRRQLQVLYDNLLRYDSCAQVIADCDQIDCIYDKLL